MSPFNKLSNGWSLSMNSLKVLKENKKLIIFPIRSGLSMILIIGSLINVSEPAGPHIKNFR